MDIKKLQRIIIDALEDVKAHDIAVFDTTDQTELFDRVIVATGTSNRQTRALASHVRDRVKAAGGQIISMEGEDSGEWVLVDLADAVVHLMQPAIRDYYRLEEVWGAKPVPARPVVRKSAARKLEAEAAEAAAAAAEPAPARPAARKAAGKAPASKPATAKAPATKSPTARKPAAKTAAAKAPAARKPAARKAASKTPAAVPGAPRRKPAGGSAA